MVVSVQYDFRTNQVSAYLKDIPNGAKRATSRGMNSLNTDIREDATKGVTSVFNIRARDAKKGIKLIRRSSARSLYVVWKARGGPIPLKSYGAKGGRPLGKHVPVTVEVTKNSRKTVAGGFIGPNDHVFKRKGKARLPIKKLWGPSLPSGFVKDQVTNSLIKLTNKLLPRRVESEMVRELRKIQTGKLPKL